MTLERSAGAALVHDGRVLVIRCRAEAFEIPKGHLEGEETAERAALRELREETNLFTEVSIGEHLGDIEYALDESKRKRVTYFVARSAETPRFGKRPSRTRELRWVTTEELDKLPLVSEDLRPLLHEALRAPAFGS